MRLCGRVFSLVFGAWLLSKGPLAFAQQEPGQWVGDLYMASVDSEEWIKSWAFIDEKDGVQRVADNPQKSAELLGLCQSCWGSSDSHWHGDALYALAGGGEAKEDGKVFKRFGFVKWQDGEWGLLGICKTARNELLHAVPCDGGRFIVISYHTDLFDDKRQDRSPFCRMSIQEGREELRLDASIDHGQDGLRKYMSGPDCFKLACNSRIIMTDGYATIVNDTGLYWVFSTETAALVKAGGIFKNVMPEMVAKGRFFRPVLCANPEKSGTVLVSAQNEDLLLAEKEDAFDVFKEAEAMRKIHPEARIDPDEVDERFYRKLEAIKVRSPLIVWYRIYPDTGRVERLTEPPEGGATLREGWDNEWWRPMPDGSVRMGWDPHRMDKLKEQVSMWSGDHVGEGAAKGAEGQSPESST